MPSAELPLPARLLAGGGPGTPDPRVLRALATPLVGQFDPAFTQIMDDVVQLARQAFQTSNPNCFAISALASGGLEAVLNSLLEEGDAVCVKGSPAYVECVRQIARVAEHESHALATVVPLIDPFTAQKIPIEPSTKKPLIVDATRAIGACELRVDEWHIDVCVAGVDYGIGAPSGMSLVTYTPAIQQRMQARKAPPRTSYLDLLQLQAYWNPERLNHHTAPTALVYGLREALRLIHEEGFEARWQRHVDAAQALREGLTSIPAIDEISGDPPYCIVHLSQAIDEPRAKQALRDQFGVHVTAVGPHQWRLGLLGNDARPDVANVVIAAMQKVLGA